MAQEHKGRKNTPAKQSSARTGRPQRKPSYQDRRQFPESASTYRQAKLLLLGCMPALRQTQIRVFDPAGTVEHPALQTLRPHHPPPSGDYDAS